MGEIVFKGYGVSVWDDEKVLQMDGGDGYTTMNVLYLMPLNYILKMIKMVNFMLCIFHHNFKKLFLKQH